MSRSSRAFERLHPGLQRWLYRQRWRELRPIQEEATGPILDGQQDVILAAPTAGGKTEAAFLPLLTALAERTASGSLAALCVSPLKALINDQFERLAEMGEAADVAVHRWHGDVPSGARKRLLDKPSGLLLITPESLEAFFVLRGPRMKALFADLRYVVIDEMHAFLGTERGRQLQSLLHRLELLLQRRVPRVALSATLGDLRLAAGFLRPGEADQVALISDRESGQQVRLQVRGYRHDTEGGDDVEVARDLLSWLRGGHHLVFANRRATVERYADLLRRLCEREKVPNEFWPHHGSLSRQLREEAERAINERRRPTTLIATTTLELGIDVGAIESVVQIGSPPSVAALRQRLGRSGRRGEAAVLRAVVQENGLNPDSPPADALRPRLLQTTAMVELLIEGWVEPPQPASLHLSTLVQQTLSVLAQIGGADAGSLWKALCAAGPFSTVDRELFADFLRCLGAADLISQEHTGELLLGLEGERVVDHHSFFAAFSSPEEYRLVSDGKTLGQLPIGQPLAIGFLLIFGGRRWRVLAVDEENKVVDLAPARGGRTPSFIGTGGPSIHDRVRQVMLDLYSTDRVPRYLDRKARALLSEARDWFARYELDRRSLLADADSTLLFPWFGDRAHGTLALLLKREGLTVSVDGFVVSVERATPDDLRKLLSELAVAPLPEPRELARLAANLRGEKFHVHLDDELLVADYAAHQLDVPAAYRALRRML